MPFYFSHQGTHLREASLYQDNSQGKCNSNLWGVCRECLLAQTWVPLAQRPKRAWLGSILVTFQCREAQVARPIRTRYAVFFFLRFLARLVTTIWRMVVMMNKPFDFLVLTVEKEGWPTRDGDAEPRVPSAEEALLTSSFLPTDWYYQCTHSIVVYVLPTRYTSSGVWLKHIDHVSLLL
jgi:hypothetical protein